jgi:pentose-5-phosphate-3-epimerase
MDPIMVTNIRRMREMVEAAGRADCVDIMEDGGLNASNVAEFIRAGMTVGEFSSPLLKGPNGKLKPGTGEITAAVQRLRAAMEIEN